MRNVSGQKRKDMSVSVRICQTFFKFLSSFQGGPQYLVVDDLAEKKQSAGAAADILRDDFIRIANDMRRVLGMAPYVEPELVKGSKQTRRSQRRRQRRGW